MEQFKEKKFDNIEESINMFMSVFGNSGVGDIVKKDDWQKRQLSGKWSTKGIEKKDAKIMRTPKIKSSFYPFIAKDPIAEYDGMSVIQLDKDIESDYDTRVIMKVF